MNKSAEQPLAEIFLIIGEEIAQAATSVDDLHALVEASVEDNRTTHGFLQQAQTIDMLQQHLLGLSNFISEITKVIPLTWCVDSGDALAKVKLSRLRGRLGKICVGAEQKSGDIQFL